MSNSTQDEQDAEPTVIDIVEEGIAWWRAERPDIDSSAKAVVGRLVRLEDRILRIVNKALKPFGLTYPSYAVLVTLRVYGKPFEMSPKMLKRSLLLTSGGLSTLLERIEQRDLIMRLPDPNDRRGVIVRLTPRGLKLVEQAMEVHARCEHRIIASLSSDEITMLTGLLRKLLLHLDDP